MPAAPQRNHRVHITVSGRVQGVGFRYFTQKKALANNVTGWVKNLPDGRVHAVLEGYENDVAEVINLCRRGPEHAAVEHMEISVEQPTGEFSTFTIR